MFKKSRERNKIINEWKDYSWDLELRENFKLKKWKIKNTRSKITKRRIRAWKA